ncbi:hypothetical protein J7T55_009214 [Diaporthe amygdali]|uniref:uncharacterized protein n=1 Tax=Phomopsis amygdali TaxID=1214568 RepID=UPI0022FDBB3A|nr:uncharacterized protein J7T55_009214 [Diaporthe amygdali]KAJ0118431.1 hypothetical protein J7T55_009214 [Diaporthe amygdali]
MVEIRQTIEDVIAVARGETTRGCLRLTDYHIIFTAPPLKTEATGNGAKERPRESWVAYPMISFCEFRPTPPSSGRESSLRVRCRDFYFVMFHFPDNKSAQDAFNLIQTRSCRLGSIDKLHAFDFHAPKTERVIHGWQLYDAKAEFRRQGIGGKLQDKGWRVSDLNADYTFSPTYPSVLVVPNKISDATLKYAASHRTRSRVPTLTYLHPVNNCSITRSSQPRVGITGNRNRQDEALVDACFANPYIQEAPPSLTSGASSSSTQQGFSEKSDHDLTDPDQAEPELLSAGDAFHDEKGKRIIFGAQQHNLIIDARPAINSMAMQVVGKGSENMEYYKFASKAYLNIQNIHVMRNSLKKVIGALKDGDISSGPPNQDLLAKSDWLKHITGILDGSALIARQVGIQHSHVLIHCSDGWDRTSQLSALSQLMLDPYYRTITGFIVLIEKDWLSFGHMFHQRSGHLGCPNWFCVQDDGMAGAQIMPGESDGRGEVLENAKNFFKKHAWSSDKDKEDSDPDNLSAAAAASERESTPVIEDQATREKEISPVFHQYLDAVYQLLRQFPDRFEFNERFLRRLLYHLHSCQYGTFLLNNEKQRIDARLHERTSSVWDYFLSRREMFTNPSYDPVVDDNVRGKERLIFPRLNEIRWWHQLFNRADKEMNGALDAAAATTDRVAKAVRSATASPRPGQSTANSIPGSPKAPDSPRPSISAAETFGDTVLAGVEVPRPQNVPNSGGVLSNLTKSISGIDISGSGGMGGKGTAAGGTAVPFDEQEMAEMGLTENVAHEPVNYLDDAFEPSTQPSMLDGANDNDADFLSEVDAEVIEHDEAHRVFRSPRPSVTLSELQAREVQENLSLVAREQATEDESAGRGGVFGGNPWGDLFLAQEVDAGADESVFDQSKALEAEAEVHNVWEEAAAERDDEVNSEGGSAFDDLEAEPVLIELEDAEEASSDNE